jgi:hypothetical protein
MQHNKKEADLKRKVSASQVYRYIFSEYVVIVRELQTLMSHESFTWQIRDFQ